MLRLFFTISLFDMFYQNVGMHFGNIQYVELQVFKKNKCNVKAHLLYKQALQILIIDHYLTVDINKNFDNF